MKATSKAHDMFTMLIIVLVAMSGLMGIDIHLASMPYMMTYMDTDKIHIQQSVTLYLLGLGVSLLFYGPLSDKYGRKPVVVFGLIVACLTSFLAVFIHGITAFLMLRLFQGVGAGASAGLGRTMAVDMFHKKSLDGIRSYFSAIIGLSPLIAPLLGGYLQHYFGWQSNFVFLSILFFILIFPYAFFTDETNRHIRPDLNLSKTLLSNYHYLLKHPAFVGATVLGGIGMAVTIIYATISPFIFQVNYHLSPIIYGWITMGVSVGVLLGRLFNGFLVKKLGNLGVLSFGIHLIILPGLFIVLIKLFHEEWMFVVLLCIFLALSGQAFLRANAMFVALLPHHDKRGSAGALFGSFQTLVGFASGALISLFSYEGMRLLGVSYIVLGLLSYLIYFGLVKYNHQESQR